MQTLIQEEYFNYRHFPCSLGMFALLRSMYLRGLDAADVVTNETCNGILRRGLMR